jgi:hypothetical protein
MTIASLGHAGGVQLRLVVCEQFLRLGKIVEKGLKM